MSFGVSPDVPPAEGSLPGTTPSTIAGKASLAASVSPQIVDSFDSTKYRATKYVLTVSQGSNYQVVEIVLMCTGADSYVESYASMSSTGVALATFSASVTASVVANLNVTLLAATAATVNFQATRVAS